MRRGLDRWSSFSGDVTEIIGYFFEAPSSLAGAVRPVMPQIVIRDVVDQVPFLFVGPPLERAEPVMDAGFAQALGALGGEYIRTVRITAALAQVVVQRLANGIEQIEIALFTTLMADVYPSHLRTEVKDRKSTRLNSSH